jgi:hypothetical protein
VHLFLTRPNNFALLNDCDRALAASFATPGILLGALQTKFLPTVHQPTITNSKRTPVLYFCWHPSQILVMTYAASMACPLRKGCKQQEIQTTAQQGLCPLHSKQNNETDSAEKCRWGRISKLNVDDWLLKPQTHRTEMQWCMSPSSFPCHSPQMGTCLDPRRD